MTNVFDRAAEREEQNRADLDGKTVDDSAHECRLCEVEIPQGRRKAYPGVQTCVDCQEEIERAITG